MSAMADTLENKITTKASKMREMNILQRDIQVV